VEVDGCDYRIPSGVQHGLVAVGSAELVVEDTDFGDVQLVTAESASLRAERLNGHFEVIAQNDSQMTLADIPRDLGEGDLWVWVEFPEGSEAVYTPPMPGFVDYWTFPPQDATGIVQTILMERCEARLWPMLVREGSTLTLRDIPEDNWVVVGLHLFERTTVSGLVNDLMYDDVHLEIGRHDIRLIDASIDTWNLYPQGRARVDVRDSLLGEILSMGHARVTMRDTTIDGSGGFFGARDHSRITATGCTFTSTIEAAQDATIELSHSAVEPHPIDPTGVFTRFGAYDQARLYAHHTTVDTTPDLGGQGLIAVSFITNVPSEPPGGTPVSLFGSVAMFSLDGPTIAEWRLEVSGKGGLPELIASEDSNVEEEVLGVWGGANPEVGHQLRIVLTDSWSRSLIGLYEVPGAGPRQRRGGVRRP
jgi:hypothetical protein